MRAEQRQLERAERRSTTADPKPRHRPCSVEIAGLPVHVFAGPECLDSGRGGRDQPPGTFAVGADEQQTLPRNESHEAAEREPHRVEVGVDVRVIELDVVDHGDVR